MNLLLNLIYAVSFNWLLLLFFAIALGRKLCGRGYKIFVWGIIIQGVIVFQDIQWTVTNSSYSHTPEKLFAILCFIVFCIGGYIILKRIGPKGEKQ